MQITDLKGSLMVQVKSGKVYQTLSHMDGSPYVQGDRVFAKQWQLNDKLEEGGRWYGAIRLLKISEIQPWWAGR